MKSSSNFLPFFFLDPFKPSNSTSSLIPRAAQKSSSQYEA